VSEECMVRESCELLAASGIGKQITIEFDVIANGNESISLSKERVVFRFPIKKKVYRNEFQ